MTSNKPRKYAHAGLDSDWSAKKILAATSNKRIRELFELAIVFGKQDTVEELEESMYSRIIQNGYSDVAKERAKEIIQDLKSGKIKYYCMNGGNPPKEEVDLGGIELALITTSNCCHLNGIRFFANRGIPIICEKPLVTVLDRLGNPTDKDLRELEEIVRQNPGLLMIDAEHYSQKLASLIFYNNLDSILTDRTGKKQKIRLVHGELLENDNPYKPRTKNVLSLQNQTGLIGDTMVHLLSFFPPLGGIALPLKREFARYSDEQVKYDVDTYDHVIYELHNNHKDNFATGAVAGLTVAKFVDRAGKAESKKIKFVLENDDKIDLDLASGKVVKTSGKEITKYLAPQGTYKEEYLNLLIRTDNCLDTGTKPLTIFENSLDTINTSFQTHKIGEEVPFYKQNA